MTLEVANIDRIVKTGGRIIVTMEGDEIYLVNQVQFEEWADENSCREWIRDWSDHNGDHQQETGSYQWYVYYCSEKFESDILKFIVQNHIKPKP